MSAVQSGASFEPYLRARNADPSLIPSHPIRGIRTGGTHNASTSEDFLDFLNKLLRLLASPVTVPLRLLHQAVTSPLTISLVLKLILLAFLTLGSAVFSVLAVGAFWYSWGTGGDIEVEGWLIYGSKNYRTPHALVQLPVERFQEDLRYDVVVEMELVRPSRGQEEMGNFMLSLELRSSRNPEQALISAAQPSLPPPPLPYTILPVPSIPNIVPCLLPWPFRGLCPSRLLGYDDPSRRRDAARRARARGGVGSPVQGKEVVLLRKDLMEGVILNPGRMDSAVGSAFVSIGREDSFSEATETNPACKQPREVRTTGWVVIRFVPRPSGVRWLLSAHPLPPLLLLPPISLTLTLSSSIFAFLIITYLLRPKSKASRRSHADEKKPMSQESLLEEKQARVFEERDREERHEAERRRHEWEEVESSALGGLRKMPEDKKRSYWANQSTIGGSETTAPSAVRSFDPVPETSDDGVSETTVTETATESGAPEERSRRTSDASEEWEEAH